jgi:hypothetical protein
MGLTQWGMRGVAEGPDAMGVRGAGPDAMGVRGVTGAALEDIPERRVRHAP